MPNLTWNRPIKNSVRRAYFTRVGVRLGTAKRYLCLPGCDSEIAGRCIRVGRSMGVITDATHILAYESDSNKVDAVRQGLADLPNHIDVYNTLIEHSRLKPKSVDCAFLDFFGDISDEMYRWMEGQFVPALADISVFAITMSFGRTQTLFTTHLRHLLDTRYVGHRDAIARQYRIEEPDMVAKIFMLKCLLRNYENGCTFKHIYHDQNSTPMMVITFELTGMKAVIPNIFPDLLREEKGLFMTDAEKRSNAAKKAHKTRKANVLFAKRSAAAHKAWATRRAA
jgi:hypothetical protein